MVTLQDLIDSINAFDAAIGALRAIGDDAYADVIVRRRQDAQARVEATIRRPEYTEPPKYIHKPSGAIFHWSDRLQCIMTTIPIDSAEVPASQ